MSYLVLARKYRPQSFEAVVQQDHVTRTLSMPFSRPHGPCHTFHRATRHRQDHRGADSGQGHELRKRTHSRFPAIPASSCREITAGKAVDVHEIDGASNNSVDQVRELRENLKYMPAHSLYKIYIIDEVHMLSTRLSTPC
jgi:DNA polymerase III subunit gamma/tau